MAAFGFDPQDDPLALGLKQRAREQRMATWAQNPSLAPLHAALGDDWDAFFQATDEAADGMPVRFSGGAAPSQSMGVPENATQQELENYRAMQSNQLAGLRPTSLIGPEKTHGKNLLASMRALRRLT